MPCLHYTVQHDEGIPYPSSQRPIRLQSVRDK